MPPKTVPTIEKVLALLEALHDKIDSQPKCECSSLRQEVADLKKSLETHLPPPSDTYSAVKKALSDATTYADKSCRAVWIGREEALSPTDTAASDQQALDDLCKELNDDVITQTLAEGSLIHKRHPEVQGDRKNRPLKLKFPTQKIRDHFLTLVRTHHPPTVTKSGGNFIRRDLCPFELELERQARIDAWMLNCKAGSLQYGIRDEKLIKFSGIPRSLPNGYNNRPPRGYQPDKNTTNGSISLDSSKMNQTNTPQSLNNSNHILAPITPMQTRSVTTTAQVKPTTSSGLRV
ncbi:hypothetical protein DXG03_008848 [Asterophora parasitica]|uniref:Uncharacterized protein n=1 Tax=Asterophora parasitica TaxID=117018 RepID=A0A9P7G429_9AGAR|nr:hypothetical protein DXG03_008848 [Asterophora parasitica]